MTRVRRAMVAVAVTSLLAGCTAGPHDRAVDPSLVNEAQLEACPTAGSPVSGGLPQLTLPCLDGKHRVDLAGLRGPAIVNVWYSTCTPCIAESHALEQFRQAAKGKVAVIGIDSEPQPNDGLHFEIDRVVHYASLSDQHEDARAALKVIGYPTTYFLDAAGHLVGNPQVGPFAGVAQVTAAVKSRLGVSVP